MTDKIFTTYAERVQEYYDRRYNFIVQKTDKLFGYLLIFQWVLGIGFSLVNSPTTWTGSSRQIHPHVFLALFLGGFIAAIPTYLVFTQPGATINRMIVAIAQILFSILFIHLTGGRIETHFHLFVSLAFLAFYRDWRPIIIGTVITLVDHFFRGLFWPESIYGVLTASPWRAVEHVSWVLFEDVVLLYSVYFTNKEARSVAESRATLWDKTLALEDAQVQLEDMYQSLECKVRERTKQLEDSQEMILIQQQSLVSASKMSALGEMAGGIAHEINTPLAVISVRAQQIEACANENTLYPTLVLEYVGVIQKTVDRIAKIINGLRFFARDGSATKPQPVFMHVIIEETLNLCREKFFSHGIKVEVESSIDISKIEVECRCTEMSQVLLNLLNNAFDAVSDTQNSPQWVRIGVVDLGDIVNITVTDSGSGITPEIRGKIMQPFFTTKEIGRGTGLGLSISSGIMKQQGGSLTLDESSHNTKFVMSLPKKSAS